MKEVLTDELLDLIASEYLEYVKSTNLTKSEILNFEEYLNEKLELRKQALFKCQNQKESV